MFPLVTIVDLLIPYCVFSYTIPELYDAIYKSHVLFFPGAISIAAFQKISGIARILVYFIQHY